MPPLDYVSTDGSPVGFNVALLAALSEEMNVNFELVTSNACSRVSMLTSGNALKHVYQDDVHDLLLKLQISAQSGEPVEHSFRVIRGNHVCKRRIKAVRVPYEDNPNPVMIAVEEDAGCQAETDARLNSDASMPVNAEAISRAAAAHPSIRGDE